jgi:hypothetical protein
MPIVLTDYNKMVVGGQVVHEGTPPEDPLTKLRKELPKENLGQITQQITHPIKASVYKQDMVTSKK